MKVFLLENVKGLGRQGEILEVKPAYGQNFLLPKKLAVLPNNPQAVALINLKRTKNLFLKEDLVKKEAALQKIDGQKFVILAKADKQGHLYGSIGPKEISSETGLDVSLIQKSFKQVGIYPLEIETGQTKIKIAIEIKNI